MVESEAPRQTICDYMIKNGYATPDASCIIAQNERYLYEGIYPDTFDDIPRLEKLVGLGYDVKFKVIIGESVLKTVSDLIVQKLAELIAKKHNVQYVRNFRLEYVTPPTPEGIDRIVEAVREFDSLIHSEKVIQIIERHNKFVASELDLLVNPNIKST